MKHIISLKTLLLTVIISLSASFFVQAETERYPIKAIDRPGIMPMGIIQIDTKAKMMGLKTVNLSAATQFGIAKNLQAGVGYDGLDFNEFGVKKIATLETKYNYLSIPHISFSATASLPIHIYDGEIIRDVTFGVPVVFYNGLMAGSILANVFHLTMREKMTVDFGFPFWYGIQFYGNWWAMIESSFGKIERKHENDTTKWTAIGFWDELPAELSLLYAFNHYVDLTGNFGFKNILKPEKTDMFFGLTLSVRAGRLFG